MSDREAREEMRRAEIRNNKVPYDGHCIRCGFAPVGADYLCRECGGCK